MSIPDLRSPDPRQGCFKVRLVRPRNPKPEAPKPEGNPKSEIRSPRSEVRIRSLIQCSRCVARKPCGLSTQCRANGRKLCDVGLRISFGFRPSDFGFQGCGVCALRHQRDVRAALRPPTPCLNLTIRRQWRHEAYLAQAAGGGSHRRHHSELECLCRSGAGGRFGQPSGAIVALPRGAGGGA